MWATTAHADAAAGDACAANLTADGKQIYAAVVAANPTLQNLRETIEEQARSLERNAIRWNRARFHLIAFARNDGACCSRHDEFS